MDKSIMTGNELPTRLKYTGDTDENSKPCHSLLVFLKWVGSLTINTQSAPAEDRITLTDLAQLLKT